MAKRRKRIDPDVEIGRVQLTVENLDRALAFYEGVLGFEITQRTGESSALLSAGGYHHHIALSTGSGDGARPWPAVQSSRFAVRYPTRAALADALRRVTGAGIALDAASDHGIGEAIYVRDPDGHGVELYYDRPRDAWPRNPDGSVRTETRPLDVDALAATEEEEAPAAEPSDGAAPATPLEAATRERLREMRIRLLNLHKVLLEDAKVAYEMDRGRVGSNASLLQLVINDPWFAWLHPLSELVVRIDETLRSDAPATEADGVMLLEQVSSLLSPDDAPEEFSRRYYEALQRQPAVIVAHAEVRRILKQAK